MNGNTVFQMIFTFRLLHSKFYLNISKAPRLLIYLIQKNGFDLLQLDIAPIASQYLSYMDSMKSLNIELTADYMVMAALLADLKSRLLLPKPAAITLEKIPSSS